MPASGQAAGDLKVERVRQETPGAGVLFFDLTLLMQGKPACTAMDAELTDDARKRTTAQFEVFRPNPLFSWKSESRGSFITLRPATYTITSIHCATSRSYVFNGPVAQIRVEPGDIVNAGNLVLEMSVQHKADLFTRAQFGAHGKVQDLAPDTVTSLKTRAPETFAKAKRRYFTVAASMK